MPIFFPDNPQRQTRIVELGTDAQNYLQEAQSDFENFQKLIGEVNDGIATIYRQANLQPPGVRAVDILKEAGVNDATDQVVAKVTQVIADIGGFIGIVKYLAPGATRALVATGAMAEETAARVLVRFTVPVIGREVEITAGDMAGSVLGGVVGGVAIAGIDLGIDAIEGAEAKAKMDEAIQKLFPMRTTTRVSQLKAKEVLSSITAVKTLTDALSGAGVTLTEQVIENLIARDVQPSIDRANQITPTSVLAQLHVLDMARQSYTSDDPSS